MNSDFHYCGTYCAALIAGYSHEEALRISYADQMTDHCTRAFLKKVGGPSKAATTQLQSEMIDARTDIVGLQDITRIWASFHFLPRDLNAEVNRGFRLYKQKYRLICGPNGDLVRKTVKLAEGRGLEAAGLAMHVLSDTWAHTYFAGTPSLVINNTDFNFYELIREGDSERRVPIVFGHNPTAKENPETGSYTGSIYQGSEFSIMNLGHGRAGHLPDYSFIRYAYIPAWSDYKEIIKDNPHDYMMAFAQMVYALQVLRGVKPEFQTDTYAWKEIAPYRKQIENLFAVRRTDDSEDWIRLGESISGQKIPPFSLEQFNEEYIMAEKAEKDNTVLGRFFKAAINQKTMVSSEISATGSWLAGMAKIIDGSALSGGIRK